MAVAPLEYEVEKFNPENQTLINLIEYYLEGSLEFPGFLAMGGGKNERNRERPEGVYAG